MDPAANLLRQEALSTSIREIIDKPENECGIEGDDLLKILDLADELANLSTALVDWIRNGGFVPKTLKKE